MYKINFKEPIHIHFIGIGGISMSGLAEILLKEGFTISGSDMKVSDMTNHLVDKGAEIMIGQTADNIKPGIDLVVYTAAIHPDNKEYQAVIEKQIPMMTRAALLGQIMDNYKNSVAVSGTHGKTTTTSMLSHVFMAGMLDPTISVGGILESIGGNIRVGNSSVFITEACEYTNSFHAFYPKISIILNVEEDHLDFFSGIEEICDSFKTFANNLTKDGLLVINGDMDSTSYIIDQLPCKVITFGLGSDCNYRPANITYDHLGNGHFDVLCGESMIGHFGLSVPGVHNITNALASIAVGLYLGISLPQIQEGLLAFGGTKRRFEFKGVVNGFTILDDYAHHPTEIMATLNSTSHYPHKELWCVFQPHTYTRTKAFLKDFAKALSHCDHVILTDIYAARELDTGEVSSLDILRELDNYQVDSHYFSTFEEVHQYVLQHCKKDDLLITMGAGDVVNIGESLIKG